MNRWMNHIRNHHQGTRFDEQFLYQEMRDRSYAEFFIMPLVYVFFQYTDFPGCSVPYQTCKESFREIATKAENRWMLALQSVFPKELNAKYEGKGTARSVLKLIHAKNQMAGPLHPIPL